MPRMRIHPTTSLTTSLTGVLAATLLLASGIATAAAQTAAEHCLGVAFSDQLGVARIAKSRAKVNFIRGAHHDKACPSLSPTCRDRPFLVAGDVVLTSERREPFVCATFANPRGSETIGWLPAAALEPMLPVATLAASAWHGTWRRIEATIRIKPAPGGALAIEGTAAWGSHDPDRVARGAVHNGEISGVAVPANSALFFSDETAASFEKVPENVCAVRMRRIAHYLVVEDNKACGGMNVSFTGLYVRR